MSGGLYIKQAIIAALVEHPEQEKYKTRAFSGENLTAMMEAIAEQGNKLTKSDFLSPDDEGKFIIDTPGFWKNFDKVRDIVAKSGEKFALEDFTRYLDKNETRNLLDSAREHGGLGKIFAVETFQGRFDEMERLWYKVPVPARRDLFKNDGLLDPALKRSMLAAEGREMPEDNLAKAGLTAADLRGAFQERGNYEEVTRKLSAAGDYLRKDYLLLPDSSGDTVFYYQGAWDKFDDISRNLKAHGEKFDTADFVRQVGYVSNILTRAAERKSLYRVFSAEHWEGRLGDMLELWSQVKEGWKTATMTAKDFDTAYAEAESKTYASNVSFGATTSKAQLLTPIDAAGATILPIGLKAFWDNFAVNQPGAVNDALSVADLRRTSGFLGASVLMGAVKFGHFDKVVDISRKSGEPITLDDFLSKDRHGNTLLNILAERSQLAQVFSPDLWAGRVDDMKALWTHVRVNDRSQVDIAQAEVAAKQATLKLQAKDRFKLGGKKPGFGM
ncbi:MAG TPA: hypothetical protein VEF76_13025 [Patescibacteria group bacterium]|nr:hypothetical protein [Patescibacteria group bacterium]